MLNCKANNVHKYDGLDSGGIDTKNLMCISHVTNLIIRRPCSSSAEVTSTSSTCRLLSAQESMVPPQVRIRRERDQLCSTATVQQTCTGATCLIPNCGVISSLRNVSVARQVGRKATENRRALRIIILWPQRANNSVQTFRPESELQQKPFISTMF